MTYTEIIDNINNRITADNKGSISKSTFRLTNIEPWFNIQTIQQLAKEIKIPRYGKSRIVINENGIELHGEFYSWDNICVTGYITKYKQTSLLVVGLTDGEIEEVQGPSEWRMGIDELGHLIELYKIKHRKC